jgi:hypothetical protein
MLLFTNYTVVVVVPCDGRSSDFPLQASKGEMPSLNCFRADTLGHLLAALFTWGAHQLTDADTSLQLCSSRAARSGRPCVQINLEIFWKIKGRGV